MAGIYDFTATLNDGREQALSEYRGKVLLIVNTASECGFTPQYEGLEQLYDFYHDRGLEILAFPCNQFGHQEPGSDAEIREFCDANFNIQFPLFAKIEVNGEGAHPIFQYLKQAAPGVLGSEVIKWNFTKFLIDREGEVRHRYASTTKPKELEKDIEALLG